MTETLGRKTLGRRKTRADVDPGYAVLEGHRRWAVVQADLFDYLPTLPECSIDAVVADPPYGLEFMGRSWDSFGGDQANAAARGLYAFSYAWAVEALRVLKPGGHLLSFGGTRTWHRIAVAIEDAGFEIRDNMAWMYGSGFPKSMDVAKAIDKSLGVDGKKGMMKRGGERLLRQAPAGKRDGEGTWGDEAGRDAYTYLPGSAEAESWQGWGTALKPAHEPIIVARKPFTGTVANNVLAHGTGALNIDGTRIPANGDKLGGGDQQKKTKWKGDGWHRPWMEDEEAKAAHSDRVNANVARAEELGRWPANVILSHHEECEHVGDARIKTNGHHPSRRKTGGISTNGHRGQERLVERGGAKVVTVWRCHPDCPVRLLDEQAGVKRSGKTVTRAKTVKGHQGVVYGAESRGPEPVEWYGDSGGPSRFFYQAKPTKKERNAGLDGFDVKVADPYGEHRGRRMDDKSRIDGKPPSVGSNNHPTVKPIDLMRYLVRLVTPPGGVVLDHCAGSGSTGCAAVLEGLRFVGVEREPEYAKIARARIAHWERQA